MASQIKGKILAVIGDEDTVVGFLLGGVGELNKVHLFIYSILLKSLIFLLFFFFVFQI